VAANGEGNGQDKLDQFEFNLDEDIEEEGATMTLGDPNGEGHHRTMKLEGSIGQFPIKAMLDSGSTHCFPLHCSTIEPAINPDQATHSPANGNRLQSNSLCKDLKFKLQGHNLPT